MASNAEDADREAAHLPPSVEDDCAESDASDDDASDDDASDDDAGDDDTDDSMVDDEQERRRRYDAAEREILDVLEEENVDDATRKRRMMRLFDRFRYEYTLLSTTLREHIRTQRRIMDKVSCLPAAVLRG